MFCRLVFFRAIRSYITLKTIFLLSKGSYILKVVNMKGGDVVHLYDIIIAYIDQSKGSFAMHPPPTLKFGLMKL
jgi:hypothetical protein